MTSFNDKLTQMTNYRQGLYDCNLEYATTNPKAIAGVKTEKIRKGRIFYGKFIEHQKLRFNNFWLFLRSLSCIGSSGRLVGRIPPSFVQIRLSDTELSPNNHLIVHCGTAGLLKSL